jgi:hypothetical protein
MARLRSSLYSLFLTAGPVLVVLLGRRWDP